MHTRNFFVLLFCCLALYADTARNFNTFLHDFDYTVYDKDLFEYCNLTAQQYKKRKVLHVDLEFKRQVTSFEFRLKVLTPRNKVAIVELSTDGCDCLRNDVAHPQIVNVILEAVRVGGSKLPKKCPIPAGERIVIQRFFLNPESFPPYTPEMNVFANLSMHINKKVVLSIHINYEFKKL